MIPLKRANKYVLYSKLNTKPLLKNRAKRRGKSIFLNEANSGKVSAKKVQKFLESAILFPY